ncbi:DNA polymerase III subunit psi [Aeromonas veronii]|uniref:DNA polymerase III subunit psi n=1 Tax=Aeromonas veronii TaxID=654 RepID=UPI0032EFAD22
MQDPLLDPLRQRILTRMGIQSWQLRAPALLGETKGPEDTPHQPDDIVLDTVAVPAPSGKLWLLADTLPVPALLGDLCQLLGLDVKDVSLIAALPDGLTPPLLWLTAPDARWPDALVCPIKPDAAHKRALWQQCRQHLPG